MGVTGATGRNQSAPEESFLRRHRGVLVFCASLVVIAVIISHPIQFRRSVFGNTDTRADAAAPAAAPKFSVDRAKRDSFHSWADAYNKKIGRQGMGHTANVRDQVTALEVLTRQYTPNAEVICELGVNLGHSASNFITAVPNPRLFVGFDFLDDQVLPAHAELEKTFPAVKYSWVKGTTADSVPAFVKTPEGAALRCDLVHIDAGHRLEETWADLVNVQPLTHNSTILFMDDCGCKSSDAWWCDGVNQAVSKGAAEGLIEIISMGKYRWSGKGTCIVRYQPQGPWTP